MAQLAGTNKDRRRQAQGHSDDRMSVVVLYGPHQRAHFSGRRDCCAVNDLRGHQGSAKVGAHITFCARGGHRVAEDLTARTTDATGSVVLLGPLDPFEGYQHSMWGDLRSEARRDGKACVSTWR